MAAFTENYFFNIGDKVSVCLEIRQENFSGIITDKGEDSYNGNTYNVFIDELNLTAKKVFCKRIKLLRPYIKTPGDSFFNNHYILIKYNKYYGNKVFDCPALRKVKTEDEVKKIQNKYYSSLCSDYLIHEVQE